jgi:hypothetical protein
MSKINTEFQGKGGLEENLVNYHGEAAIQETDPINIPVPGNEAAIDDLVKKAAFIKKYRKDQISTLDDSNIYLPEIDDSEPYHPDDEDLEFQDHASLVENSQKLEYLKNNDLPILKNLLPNNHSIVSFARKNK